MNRAPSQLDLALPDELVVDLFAGGGGASLGIERGIGRAVDIAVNHDPEAVAMHSENHPDTLHFCESVFKVDPTRVTGGQPVGLLWASPDCTHHSKAKGGKPVSSKRRGLAWVVVKWARRVRPRCIMLENVEEFADWGPLTPDGKPCKVRKGQTFRQWVGQIERLGYQVEHRMLRGCDYGAPTIRRRLFIIARCDGRPIVWPKATHADPASPAAKRARLKPYRTAAECIDWSIDCPSIFTRKRPLADNTMRRIAKGIQRFVLDTPAPFIIKHRTGSVGSAIDDPVHTITAGSYVTRPAGAGHAMGLCVPYFAPRYGERAGQEPRTYPVSTPAATITPDANGARLVSAFLTEHANASTQRVFSVEQPTRTQCANVQRGHFALVSAFMAKHYGGHETPGAKLCDPLSTITTQDHHALVAAHLLNQKGTDQRHRDLREPTPTICAHGNHAGLVAALMAPYYGSGSGETGRDLRKPSPTLTTRDRLQLVTVQIDGETYVLTDIGMRMLTPRELYRAQGFPDSYIIDTADGKRLTKTAQVRMVGNSVCPPVAQAIVCANFAHERSLREASQEAA